MWKKGESGNPQGSQKRRLITGNIERALSEAAASGNGNKARAIAEQVVKMAEEGDRWAIQFVTERTEGRPDQNVNIRQTARELSDADLANIAAGSGEGVAEPQSGAEVASKLH